MRQRASWPTSARLRGFGTDAGLKAPYVSAQAGPRQPVLALTWTKLVADAWGFFQWFGAAAEPEAPYVSTQTGPRQPVWTLTWATLIADAWGFRGLAQLRGPKLLTSAPRLAHVSPSGC